MTHSSSSQAYTTRLPNATKTMPLTLLDTRPIEAAPIELPAIPQYPTEVETLLNLLRDLPPDVSAAAGALIIRSTLDQLGGSLSAVLRQAQDVQNDCLGAVRDYLDDIDRCRERIRALEANAQHCQDKATELADLIDLFLLSDTSDSDAELVGATPVKPTHRVSALS